MIEPLSEETHPDEDETLGCGYSYDHDTREVETVDGYTTCECRSCGAEWIEGDGDDE